MFYQPQVNLYVTDVLQVVRFYAGLGFQETFRTPETGEPIHVELTLDQFTLGIASIDSAREMHDIPAGDGSPKAELVLWTDDVDTAFNNLVNKGAPVISPPHDFIGTLRAAWVSDPVGNPLQLVQKLI